MAGLMAKIQEISKKRKAGFRRLDESEEDNENMLVQTYSDEEIEDLDALKESAEDVGGYVKEVQDEDGETEYEVCVPHLEAKNFENIATEKGAFKTDEEDDETLEEKAKSKKRRKAKFNEEDDETDEDDELEEDEPLEEKARFRRKSRRLNEGVVSKGRKDMSFLNEEDDELEEDEPLEEKAKSKKRKARFNEEDELEEDDVEVNDYEDDTLEEKAKSKKRKARFNEEDELEEDDVEVNDYEDDTLEEKAKSKKRKARFNEEDDILKDDISDEEDDETDEDEPLEEKAKSRKRRKAKFNEEDDETDEEDENLEECGLSEFRKQNVFTKIANRPVDEAEYTKEEYQAMADELRRVADDLEDGDFDDTSRLQAIRDLMPNVGKLRAGISVNEEEETDEDDDNLEEADDNDFKRKNLKAANGRVLDFQKEKISTIQDYIDGNWDDIMDIMKSGELRQVFGLNIEENKKFDSTKLYLGSADKKTQSNIVKRATNFARKNPGLFVSLSFNFLTFGVLKNGSVVETIKPLMQNYQKAGYAEYISITDKRLSKVLKK